MSRITDADRQSFVVPEGFKSHSDLGIALDEHISLFMAFDAMRSGRIKHVKDYKYLEFGPEEFCGKFNMQEWIVSADCGTVGCIGGTAKLLSGVEIDTWSSDAIDDLFFNAGACNEDTTVEQATTALENFLRTGDAKWESIL